MLLFKIVFEAESDVISEMKIILYVLFPKLTHIPFVILPWCVKDSLGNDETHREE